MQNLAIRRHQWRGVDRIQKQICLMCKIKFLAYKSNQRKFCSVTCHYKYAKYQKLSIDHINKIRIANSNFNSACWKGNKVSYSGLHHWVRKYLGKHPHQCKFCGIFGKKNGKNWNIWWANRSHKYKRDLTDWLPLCISCHKKYDS